MGPLCWKKFTASVGQLDNYENFQCTLFSKNFTKQLERPTDTWYREMIFLFCLVYTFYVYKIKIIDYSNNENSKCASRKYKVLF